MKTKKLKQYEDYDKEYMIEYLRAFIYKELQFTKQKGVPVWMLDCDDKTEIRFLALDYIDKHFKLEEIFVIFNYLKGGVSFKLKNIEYNKSYAIYKINRCNNFTYEESFKLKRKIWNMDLMTFAAIYQLIFDSQVFWDNETINYLKPWFQNSESNLN
ncbi:MAG: hypothetical protein JXR36_08990 [Bacteroidales bacterium]|nr:hypothetical protein [Bacteroidales bacterium]